MRPDTPATVFVLSRLTLDSGSDAGCASLTLCRTAASIAACADAGALLVDQLLPKDVCVPAVLGELTQHVEVHPA